MSRIHELRTAIGDFIRHPRRLDPLLRDTPNWNRILSSFDTIVDTDLAIEAYKTLPPSDSKGYLYLTIYGLLQALYVQQDAVESLVRGFRPNQTPLYKIENEAEAKEIRDIRNMSVGHPTQHGNAGSSKMPGVQRSHHISQPSMSRQGFQLMITSADASHTFREVNLSELIEKNTRMVERVLQTIMKELEAAEMEHRKEFREMRLGDIFPPTLDYSFEKVSEGARKNDAGHRQMGKLMLDEITRIVQKFRDSLTERGILNQTSDYEDDLAEVEYPLAELSAYFLGTGMLNDSRAAEIFIWFVRDRVRRLLEMAQRIDQEYSEDLKH